MKNVLPFLGLIATTAMPTHAAILSGTFTGQVSSGEEVVTSVLGDPPIRRSLAGNTFFLETDIDTVDEDFDTARMYVLGGTGPSNFGVFEPAFASLNANYQNGLLRVLVGVSGSGFGNKSGSAELFADRVNGQFVNWRGSGQMGGQTGPQTSFTARMTMDSLTFIGIYAGPIPEPATWAMMIAGFGLAGAAIRQTRSENVPA